MDSVYHVQIISEQGDCEITVRLRKNACQLRLDFLDFEVCVQFIHVGTSDCVPKEAATLFGISLRNTKKVVISLSIALLIKMLPPRDGACSAQDRLLITSNQRQVHFF